MKPAKLNLTMIVPPEDVLLEELTDIKGGAAFNICLKGCCGGDSKGKEKDKTTTQTEDLATQP